MKKSFILRTWLLLLTILFCTSVASAETVVDLGDQQWTISKTNFYTRTVDEITIEFDQTSGSTRNPLTNEDGHLRVYSGQTLSFSVSGAQKLISIAIECTASGTSNNGPSKVDVKNNGEYSYTTSSKVGTWSGCSSEVIFTASAQWRPVKATITIIAGSEDPCTISFNAGNGQYNGGNITETSAGSGITLPVATPNEDCVLAGWEFAGWSETEVTKETNESPTILAPNTIYYPNENKTLYAVYKLLKGGEGETLLQTLAYDTWTYYGDTQDQGTYRVFPSNSYILSEPFDVSLLSKVIVYGGTFGGSTNNGIRIQDTDNNLLYSGTVSGNLQTGTNVCKINKDDVSSGIKQIKIVSNSGVLNTSSPSSSSGIRISKVEIFVNASYYYALNPEVTILPVTIGSTGVTPFCSKNALDFSEISDIKAFVISSENQSDGTVTATQIKGTVAGSTAMLLKGKPETVINIPVVSEGDTPGTNLLKCWWNGASVSPSTNTTFNYVYGHLADGVTGFVLLTGSKDMVNNTGRNLAYLQCEGNYAPNSSSEAPVLKIKWNVDLTGVEDLTVAPESGDDAMYNVMGQKVGADYKGIVIKNGKKYINK